jgi:predicted SAM-dependent methyltransferase
MPVRERSSMIDLAIQHIKRHPSLFNFLKYIYIFIIQLDARRRWKNLVAKQGIKLELGSGKKRGKGGWVTIDLFGADINYNLSKGIPLPDNKVDSIYTSHFLEHFSYKSILFMLRECRRVLKEGGELLISVPDAGRYIKSYLNKIQFRGHDSMYQPAIVDTGCYIDQVNYIAYMNGDHHYMFDEENIVAMLKSAGFGNVTFRQFDPLMDVQKRDDESLHVRAVR